MNLCAGDLLTKFETEIRAQVKRRQSQTVQRKAINTISTAQNTEIHITDDKDGRSSH